MASVKFHIRCTEACPIAQRVMIALLERGVSYETEIVPAVPKNRSGRSVPLAGAVPLLTVRRDGYEPLLLSESIAMVELVEELHPEHPLHPADPFDRARHRELMELGRLIQMHLSAATRATEQNELDILVYRLREPLSRADTYLKLGYYRPNDEFTNADVIFAPTLWRLNVLSRTSQSFLLAGYSSLIAWSERLLARPSVAQVFHRDAEAIYLNGLRRRAATILDPATALAWAELVNRTSSVRGAG